MAQNLAYDYAEIELDTGLCVGVMTSSAEINDPHLIPIPVYDDEYVDKYYINGDWYEDAEGTIPWTSSML